MSVSLKCFFFRFRGELKWRGTVFLMFLLEMKLCVNPLSYGVTQNSIPFVLTSGELQSRVSLFLSICNVYMVHISSILINHILFKDYFIIYDMIKGPLYICGYIFTCMQCLNGSYNEDINYTYIIQRLLLF